MGWEPKINFLTWYQVIKFRILFPSIIPCRPPLLVSTVRRFPACQSPAAKVFESFGEIRCVDIPVLDPYRRNNMKEAKTFSTFDAHLTFEAYIQYVEYISFVKVCDGYMTVDVWSEQ